MGLRGTHRQMGLFEQEMPTTTTTRQKGIPVYRVTLVKDGKVPCYYQRITNSSIASNILCTYLNGADREHFVILMLDRKNQVIGINTVSIGSLSASVVHPRECFKPAIPANAAAVICGHNHPSGDPQPSQEDRTLTKRLVEAGRLLGIAVLDHIVIGDGRYFSFADEGVL